MRYQVERRKDAGEWYPTSGWFSIKRNAVQRAAKLHRELDDTGFVGETRVMDDEGNRVWHRGLMTLAEKPWTADGYLSL